MQRDKSDMVDQSTEIHDLLLSHFQLRWTAQSNIEAMDYPILSSSVFDEQNLNLIKAVSIDEIENALWGMHPDKAPGPDDFPIFFFQTLTLLLLLFKLNRTHMHVNHISLVFTFNLTFAYAYFLPTLILNIISVDQLCDLRVTVRFSSTSYVLYDI